MDNTKGRLLNIATACTVVLGIIFLTVWIKSAPTTEKASETGNLAPPPNLFQTLQHHEHPSPVNQLLPRRSPTPFWNIFQHRVKKPSKTPAQSSSRPTHSAPTKTPLPPPG